MSKYHNIKTKGYASKDEHKRAQDLLLMEKAGLISNLKFQVRYELIPKQHGERACHYTADFVYSANGSTTVEDCKGYRTKDYIIKRKLMLWIHGVRIKETSHGER